MSEWLERVYTIFDLIGNFFSWIYDSVTQGFQFVVTSFHYIQNVIGLIPDFVAIPASIILAVGLIYLILGR